MQKINAGWMTDGLDESTDMQCTSAVFPCEGRPTPNSLQTSSLVLPNNSLGPNTIPTSIPATPSSSAPQLGSNELEKLYTGKKTAISQAKKEVLAWLYSHLTGMGIDDCPSLTRGHLKELIFALVSFSRSSQLLLIFNLNSELWITSKPTGSGSQWQNRPRPAML